MAPFLFARIRLVLVGGLAKCATRLPSEGTGCPPPADFSEITYHYLGLKNTVPSDFTAPQSAASPYSTNTHSQQRLSTPTRIDGAFGQPRAPVIPFLMHVEESTPCS